LVAAATSCARTFRAVARPLPINRTLRPQDITVGVFGRQRERSGELLIGYGLLYCGLSFTPQM